MKIIFDTSVLIASIIENHPHHNRAFPWLKKARSNNLELFISSHSLIEVYSVLTRAPFQPRISPKTAKRLIEENIKDRAVIISLTANDHFEIIARLSELGVAGGAVYDALIVMCARKANVDSLLTLNTDDFVRLGSDQSIRILAP